MGKTFALIGALLAGLLTVGMLGAGVYLGICANWEPDEFKHQALNQTAAMVSFSFIIPGLACAGLVCLWLNISDIEKREKR